MNISHIPEFHTPGISTLGRCIEKAPNDAKQQDPHPNSHPSLADWIE